MAKTTNSSFSRDLLQEFPVKPKEEFPVELKLGLSLNGKFGIEPQKFGIDNEKKLFRGSSMTDFVNFPVDVELTLSSPLTRTCSLPAATEVEWRKRKELQSLRRSEAKRKRVEKLKNNGRVVKGKIGEDLVAGVESPILSQGSIGSQGSGGSSGISELDSLQPFHGTNKEASETQKRCKHVTFQAVEKKVDKEIMPCVSTRGDGPEGRKIQGFLYRYGKGEEIRIVCVCHGSFLTPAEFVKHGGGGEVQHPLRHIIVDSSSVV